MTRHVHAGSERGTAVAFAGLPLAIRRTAHMEIKLTGRGAWQSAGMRVRLTGSFVLAGPRTGEWYPHLGEHGRANGRVEPAPGRAHRRATRRLQGTFALPCPRSTSVSAGSAPAPLAVAASRLAGSVRHLSRQSVGSPARVTCTGRSWTGRAGRAGRAGRGARSAQQKMKPDAAPSSGLLMGGEDQVFLGSDRVAARSAPRALSGSSRADQASRQSLRYPSARSTVRSAEFALMLCRPRSGFGRDGPSDGARRTDGGRDLGGGGGQPGLCSASRPASAQPLAVMLTVVLIVVSGCHDHFLPFLRICCRFDFVRRSLLLLGTLDLVLPPSMPYRLGNAVPQVVLTQSGTKPRTRKNGSDPPP